ncbi:hypothetical protein Hypma_006168 [Hypsizygus marmoreus]|uniref:BTB domain-containing protein n=1 Tax=Hypsizygus marmoreus TaxID=39966 RepID=A0A369JV70_HYPMA|nr:hypothetical protein Hypma_006168 [Hypsizygus marmoreus]
MARLGASHRTAIRGFVGTTKPVKNEASQLVLSHNHNHHQDTSFTHLSQQINFEMAESRQAPMPDTQTSDRFSAPDADLVFRSSDGVIFRIHSRFLENTTESFPKPKDFPANREEIIDLPEKSSTL